MKDILLSFLSRKFVSAHISIIAVFIITVMTKWGITENVAMAAIGAVSAITLSYQGANALSKGKEDVKPNS